MSGLLFAASALGLWLTNFIIFPSFGGDGMRQDVLSPQARREVRRDTALRRARTCYGYLAGVAGVHLLEELLRLGWLEAAFADADSRRVGYAPTVAGAAALGRRGVGLRRRVGAGWPRFLVWTGRSGVRIWAGRWGGRSLLRWSMRGASSEILVRGW